MDTTYRLKTLETQPTAAATATDRFRQSQCAVCDFGLNCRGRRDPGGDSGNARRHRYNNHGAGRCGNHRSHNECCYHASDHHCDNCTGDNYAAGGVDP